MRGWAALVALSAACTLALASIHLSAAYLLGPLIAAIAMATREARVRVRVPAVPFTVAQGVVGCLIARGIPPAVAGEIGKEWPLFAAGVFVVIAAAATIGYALARLRVLPGSTAVWGSSPGAATAMVLLAKANGADVRLVAVMPYLRVVCVAAVASDVAQTFASSAGAHAAVPVAVAFVPRDFAITLAIALSYVGKRFGVPAGALLVPLFAAAVAQDAFRATIVLPPWLLVPSYALVAWTIDLRFTRSIVVYAARALPRVLASIALLIAVCGAFGALLVRVAGIDPLTAYLATSPGGADPVAIIAANSKVDVPFVVTMQTARFVIVMLIGPTLSKFVARFTPADVPA